MQDDIDEAIDSKSDSLKDKKIKELAAKVKNLQLLYEREKMAYLFRLSIY